MTIRVYLHSFSCHCLRNTRNVAKFQENLTLQQFKIIQVIDLGGVNGKPIYDFLLVINSNFSVSATVFEIFRLKYRKLLILPPLPCLTPTLGTTPFEFCDEIWRHKPRIMWLPDGEEIMTKKSFFVLVQYRHVTDRRTDGRTRCSRKDPR